MDWLTQMSLTGQILFWIAVVATVGLIVQIIMMIFSFGGDDIDFSDFDGDIDTDGGLSVFTLKGLTAFFALGGWCGFAMISYVPNIEWLAILVAFITGTCALLGVGFAMKAMSKLQCSGNIDHKKLEGLSATVYVSIPPNRDGRGKITLTAQGRYMELDAVSDSKERISTDSKVKILSYENDFVVVEKETEIDNYKNASEL